MKNYGLMEKIYSIMIMIMRLAVVPFIFVMIKDQNLLI